MARQAKLMASLDPSRPTSRGEAAPAPAPVLSGEQRDQRLALEGESVDAAFVALSEGRLDDALARLLPLAEHALDPRTLTTLARIRSVQGHFDEALDWLAGAERLSPADPKVLYFTAELLKTCGRFQEEVAFRRRLAFSTVNAPAEHYVRLATAIVKAASSAGKVPAGELRLALDRVRAAPDASAELRVELARSMFGVKGLSDEALEFLRAADPTPADCTDTVVPWQTLPEYCASSGAPLRRAAEHGAPGRRPLLAELGTTVVHPALQWMPMPGDGQVLLAGHVSGRLRVRAEDPASPLLLASAARAVLRLPCEIARLDGPALLVGGYGAYYHDVVDHFGALAVAETLGLDDDVPILLNDDLAAHQHEWLDLLGVSPERLRRWPRSQPVRLDRLFVPSRLAAGGRWFDPLLPSWYRRRVQTHLRGGTPARKLYLSRSGTQRRRIDNEAALEAALARAGFETVRPETLSVREQVQLFSQASHVVGSSGAALTNVMFCAPGARVVVLQNRHLVAGGGDLYFDALATACGHRASTLACSPVRLQPGQRAIDADLQVDVAALLDTLA